MLKNTAGQFWRVFAFDLATGSPVTGDAANITAKIAIDGGALAATNDVNPTETEDGYYQFALTQAETNGNDLALYPESSTNGVQVIGVPGSIATAVANSGTGARTVTATVTVSAAALQGAIVRLTLGAETYRATTNASGVATLNVDDGTYTVSISKPGYSFAGATLVVDGAETPAYAMTLNAVSVPADPTLATLVVVCVDEFGAVEAGATIDAKLIKIPASSVGYAFDGIKQTATSDASGVAELTVVRGATYKYRRGTSELWTEVVIADAASTTVTSIIGVDA